jgi:hypothetical protein
MMQKNEAIVIKAPLGASNDRPPGSQRPIGLGVCFTHPSRSGNILKLRPSIGATLFTRVSKVHSAKSLVLFLIGFLSAGPLFAEDPVFLAGKGGALSVQLEEGRRGLWFWEGGAPACLTGQAHLRGFPAIYEGSVAWIEEISATSRVCLRSAARVQTLAETDRGRLMDVALGPYGVAWSEFAGTSWDVYLWRDGRLRRFGMAGADEVSPVVTDTGLAWISCCGMRIHINRVSGEGPPEELPGHFAERLSHRGDALTWLSRTPKGPKAWIHDSAGARVLTTDFQSIKGLFTETETVLCKETAGKWNPDWERLTPANPPFPRTTHATVGLSGGRTLVFGGEVWDQSSSHFQGFDSAVWILDPEAGKWTSTKPRSPPRERCHTPLAYDPHREKVLLWGGAGLSATGEFELLEDTWLLDTKDLSWTRIETPEGPPAGADAGLIHDASADRFLLFHRGQFWEFQTGAQVWKRVEIPPGPSPREGATVALNPDCREVLFFGGNAGTRYLDDTWLLDLELGRWREVVGDVHPSARVRAAFAVNPHERSVVLYGGVRGPTSRREKDLWVFDFDQDRWELVSADTAISPQRRGGFHGMAYNSESRTFTLFGGRSDEVFHHNDTWRLHLTRTSP